jgi:hypothetical protein
MNYYNLDLNNYHTLNISKYSRYTTLLTKAEKQEIEDLKNVIKKMENEFINKCKSDPTYIFKIIDKLHY